MLGFVRIQSKIKKCKDIRILKSNNKGIRVGKNIALKNP